MTQQPSEMRRAGLHGRVCVGWCGELALLASMLAGCASAALPLAQQEATHLDGGLFDLEVALDAAMPNDLQYDLAGRDLTSSGTHDLTMSGCGISSLKVNEVSTSGPGGATDEYVELYNPCANTVALSGASVTYRSAAGTTDTSPLVVFTASQSIASHGYFLIANAGYASTADVKPFASGASGLADAGGGIALENASVRVDSVGWGTATNAFVETTPVGAPGSTKSASRMPDGTDTNDNVVDFQLTTRSPGAAN
jgi:hypothetical protein